MEMDGDNGQRCQWMAMEMLMDEQTATMEMDVDGNDNGQADSNGQQWRWMAMEMAIDKRAAMDENGDGWQWK